jgi:hypothetical protein
MLSGASAYEDPILSSERTFYVTQGVCEFVVADWRPDLVALLKRDTGTSATKVHVTAEQDCSKNSLIYSFMYAHVFGLEGF